MNIYVFKYHRCEDGCKESIIKTYSNFIQVLLLYARSAPMYEYFVISSHVKEPTQNRTSFILSLAPVWG